VAGLCEHDNEPFGSIRKDIFETLSDDQLPK
jgi:hypothetical protein